MNKLYLGNCIEVMKSIEDESVDMVITSPPYDNLRSYNGCSWNFDVFKKVAQGLKRVLKKEGVIVWIVNDQTINGTESGTSFKHALYFKEIGLRLHDTMIWEKYCSNYPSGSHSLRYTNIFEYMFILSKGRPKNTNLIRDKPNKYAGKKLNWNNNKRYNIKGEDISIKVDTMVEIKDFGIRNNIWKIKPDHIDKSKHPAKYPENLVKDHILTWSNKGDIVLDCFAGSGTSLKVANVLERRFIGIELNEEYMNIIENRLKKYDVKYDKII